MTTDSVRSDLICDTFFSPFILLLVVMRDILPSRDRRNSLRTPWTTYTDVTPKVSTQRRAASTSTRKNRRLQPESISSPSSDELPYHESFQLPRKLSTRRGSKAGIKRSPIDIIEDFIRDLPPEDKEAVRVTYNGPDWPTANRFRKRTFVPPTVLTQDPIYQHQPIAFMQHVPPVMPAFHPHAMTCLDLSRGYSPPPHFISPPMTPTPNRFLNYLSSQNAFSPLGPVPSTHNFFHPRGS
jgi:hypothetical protein